MWVKRLSKIFQWFWWISGSIVIVMLLIFALLLNVARIATPWLNKHPEKVQKQIDSVWPGHIQFNKIHWSWSWFSPQVVLQNVQVQSENKMNDEPESLSVNQMKFSLNLWESLLHWHLHLNAINAENTNIIIRQLRNGYLVNGFFVPKEHSSKPFSLDTILNYFNKVKVTNIDLKNLGIQLYLLNHAPIHIQIPDIVIAHNHPVYRLHGQLSVSPDHIKNLQFWVRENQYTHIIDSCIHADGLNVSNIKQWTSLLPLLKRLKTKWQPILHFHALINGTGWLHVKNNIVDHGQAQIVADDMAIQNKTPVKSLSIGNVSANLAFVRSHLQWQFSADNLLASKADNIYNLGNFQLTYHGGAALQRSWDFTGNQINLKVLSQPIWTKLFAHEQVAMKYLKLQPSGTLPFVHLHLSGLTHQQHADHPVNFTIKTILNDVSWHAVGKIPGVSNLNGYIVGDKNKGKLKLFQGLGLLDAQVFLNFHGL